MKSLCGIRPEWEIKKERKAWRERAKALTRYVPTCRPTPPNNYGRTICNLQKPRPRFAPSRANSTSGLCSIKRATRQSPCAASLSRICLVGHPETFTEASADRSSPTIGPAEPPNRCSHIGLSPCSPPCQAPTLFFSLPTFARFGFAASPNSYQSRKPSFTNSASLCHSFSTRN